MCRHQTQMQTFFQYLQGDRTIWLIALLLSLFSVLAVYSATGSLAFQQSGGNTEYYLFKQITIVGIGLLLMYGAHLINYNYYSRIAQLLLYISIPLLVFTLLFGRDFNDAQRTPPAYCRKNARLLRISTRGFCPLLHPSYWFVF